MTYTESNQSFVSSILKPFFQQVGVNIPETLFNEIVEKICTEDGYENLNMTNSHDYITQQGLNLLKDLKNDRNLKM